MKAYESGVSGEQLAEKYLVSQGMVCLERRYRALSGEIDLIMRDGTYIVFVEVKYRPMSRAGAGLTAVTRDKQRRMTKAASKYLLTHGGLAQDVRFDVVEVTADGVLHIPNAFYAFG